MHIRQAVGATHPGRVRTLNEDAMLRMGKVPLYAVADGMGGEGAGDRASEMALDMLKANLGEMRKLLSSINEQQTTNNRLALGGVLQEVFSKASRAIFDEAQSLDRAGMGSTLLLATLAGRTAFVAHVGDSRAYLLRGGDLIRLTEDHTVAELRFRRGRITEDEYLTCPERNLLYQALGNGGDVEVDVAEIRMINNDMLLLCSDGLVRAIDDQVIADCIEISDLAGSVRQLIRRANQAGAEDNVTVIGLVFEEDDPEEGVTEISEVLRNVFLLKSVSEQERLLVAPYLEEHFVEKGQIIVREGDPADSFFVIVSGKVRISSENTTLVELGAGKHFGELALARPTKRSATVSAIEDTQLFFLTRERFHDLMKQKPDLGSRLSLALLDTVGTRLRDLTNRLAAAERAVHGELR